MAVPLQGSLYIPNLKCMGSGRLYKRHLCGLARTAPHRSGVSIAQVLHFDTLSQEVENTPGVHVLHFPKV